MEKSDFFQISAIKLLTQTDRNKFDLVTSTDKYRWLSAIRWDTGIPLVYSRVLLLWQSWICHGSILTKLALSNLLGIFLIKMRGSGRVLKISLKLVKLICKTIISYLKNAKIPSYSAFSAFKRGAKIGIFSVGDYKVMKH